MSASHLLILDLDETLIHATETPLDRPADFSVGRYHVYGRPHLERFLTFCLAKFQVAIWTSSTRYYALEIVRQLFPDPSSLAFVWARERCTWRYDDQLGEYAHAKRMYKVRRLGYDLERVIVVDDSPEKWRDAYGNLVQVKAFQGNPDNELHALERYLEILQTHRNIRRLNKRRWFET
jgi:carboxy-terminal domain RNA polymerase II polypeptide A small phosphatase